jgi:hypothetical protein
LRRAAPGGAGGDVGGLEKEIGMELLIKDASEYKAAQDAAVDRIKDIWQAAAVEFINNTVVPDLDDRMQNPNLYTSASTAVFKVTKYPADKFVAAVSELLTPKGFTVTESHDGGGMYATVVISWD